MLEHRINGTAAAKAQPKPQHQWAPVFEQDATLRQIKALALSLFAIGTTSGCELPGGEDGRDDAIRELAGLIHQQARNLHISLFGRESGGNG